MYRHKPMQLAKSIKVHLDVHLGLSALQTTNLFHHDSLEN